MEGRDSRRAAEIRGYSRKQSIAFGESSRGRPPDDLRRIHIVASIPFDNRVESASGVAFRIV